MGDAMAVVLLILVFALNYISKAKKKNQKEAKQLNQNTTGVKKAAVGQKRDLMNKSGGMQDRTGGYAAVGNKTKNDNAGSFDQYDRDGSIIMPPAEPHVHEGKEMPCPAEERERPRPRTVRAEESRGTAKKDGLNICFTKNSFLQAFILSEVLKRPNHYQSSRTENCIKGTWHE